MCVLAYCMIMGRCRLHTLFHTWQFNTSCMLSDMKIIVLLESTYFCMPCFRCVFLQHIHSLYFPLQQLHALFFLCAQLIVIHAFIPTFLFSEIVGFIIFNIAHLSCSYLLYSFFFTGIRDLMIPRGSIKVWSYFNFSFEISGRNSILNFIWFSDAAL